MLKFLKSKWAQAINIVGRILSTTGYKINNAGSMLITYSVGIDPHINEYVKFSRNLESIVANSEQEMQEKVIALQVKKGGCEVQTGNFRRIDCSDNVARSKKYFEKVREQNIKCANERLKEINARIDQTEELIGVKERIDKV